MAGRINRPPGAPTGGRWSRWTGASRWASGRYHRGWTSSRRTKRSPRSTPHSQRGSVSRTLGGAARNLVYLQNNAPSELEVDLSRILGISDPAAVGLTAADLTGPDHQPCPELAAAAMGLGDEALLVTSAALPGLSLVVLPRTLPESPPPGSCAARGSPSTGSLKSSGRKRWARIAYSRGGGPLRRSTSVILEFFDCYRLMRRQAVVFLCSYRDTAIDEFKLEHRYQIL